jgi:hypothetical protein
MEKILFNYPLTEKYKTKRDLHNFLSEEFSRISFENEYLVLPLADGNTGSVLNLFGEDLSKGKALEYVVLKFNKGIIPDFVSCIPKKNYALVEKVMDENLDKRFYLKFNHIDRVFNRRRVVERDK